jgi:hypothetical protein
MRAQRSAPLLRKARLALTVRKPSGRKVAFGVRRIRAHRRRAGMAIGLSGAAAATFKAGRLSATRTDTGQVEVEVEPAELFRVFPPIASQQGAHDAAPYGATDGSTHNAFQDSALEHELREEGCEPVVETVEQHREMPRWGHDRLLARRPQAKPIAEQRSARFGL